MSRDLSDKNYYVSHGGKVPVKWTAPEVTSSICLIVTILKLFLSLYLKALHFRKYTTASDVWSYGAVMYEIWSLGHNPFKSYTNQEVNLSCKLAMNRN